VNIMEQLSRRAAGLRAGVHRLIAWARVGVAQLLRRLAMQWQRVFRAVVPPRRALGQGLVEYALILVLIAIVVIGTLTALGNQTNNVFAEVECSMRGGEMHQDQGQGNSNRCR
jgi:pilus assembly protein Flp/PilA